MLDLDRIIKRLQKTNGGKKLYITREAAERAGISRQSLQTWIKTGRIKAPELTLPFGVRFWTEEDIALLKRVERRKPVDAPKRGKSESSKRRN